MSSSSVMRTPRPKAYFGCRNNGPSRLFQKADHAFSGGGAHGSSQSRVEVKGKAAQACRSSQTNLIQARSPIRTRIGSPSIIRRLWPVRWRGEHWPWPPPQSPHKQQPPGMLARSRKPPLSSGISTRSKGGNVNRKIPAWPSPASSTSSSPSVSCSKTSLLIRHQLPSMRHSRPLLASKRFWTQAYIATIGRLRMR